MNWSCRSLRRRQFLQAVGRVALFAGCLFAGCTAAGTERQPPPEPTHLSEAESPALSATVPSVPPTARGDLPVRFADTGVGANAPIYVALKRGYFREEG